MADSARGDPAVNVTQVHLSGSDGDNVAASGATGAGAGAGAGSGAGAARATRRTRPAAGVITPGAFASSRVRANCSTHGALVELLLVCPARICGRVSAHCAAMAINPAEAPGLTSVTPCGAVVALQASHRRVPTGWTRLLSPRTLRERRFGSSVLSLHGAPSLPACRLRCVAACRA